MKNRRRSQHRQARREVIATWVAAILLGIFAWVFLTFLALSWLRPEAAQSAALQQLLAILAPLVTLAVQWYLRRHDRGRRDD